MSHRTAAISGASLVTVANRLPFDIQEQPDGSTLTRQAPGGLVTALAPLLAREHGAWVGWPGTADLDLAPTESDGIALRPVRLSGDEVAAYYEGFSNGTLWPLYHDAVVQPEFHRQWWETYRRVNERFAKAAADVAAEGAVVWVHDYQLQLVPAMLRRLRPDVRIGFFLHIPFPPPELFLRLPWRTEVMTGILGADVIGFQLRGGVRNFTRMARTLMGAAASGSRLEHDGRTIRVAAFPISIDSAHQDALARSERVRAEAQRLRRDLGDPRKVILGVDRLDYTKGINVRLRAFRELLAAGDPAVADTVLVQIATPSRERLASYSHMREQIERQVGAINGDHARIGQPAVHYLHQSFPRDELAAFYVAADVMAVTPLRDGMNLVAKEFVASKTDGTGVLLLSEFAGAAQELHSSVLVNPFDTDGVKEGLRRALTMDERDTRSRMRALHRQVMTHDVDRWAASFLDAVRGYTDRVASAAGHLPANVVKAMRAVSAAETLLVATDFDGTLAPLVKVPDTARAIPNALATLHAIAELPGTEVAIVSGRGLADLQAILGDPGRLFLVGSHGAEFRVPPGSSAVPARPVLTAAQQEVLTRLRAAVESLPGRFPGVRLDHKLAGLAVHTREADDALEPTIVTEIEALVADEPGIHVLYGKRIVELSVVTADKGTALRTLRSITGATAATYFGDDVTDEDAFATLGPGDVGVKVGEGASAAKLRVDGPDAVADLLGVLHSARGAAVRSTSR